LRDGHRSGDLTTSPSEDLSRRGGGAQRTHSRSQRRSGKRREGASLSWRDTVTCQGERVLCKAGNFFAGGGLLGKSKIQVRGPQRRALHRQRGGRAWSFLAGGNGNVEKGPAYPLIGGSRIHSGEICTEAASPRESGKIIREKGGTKRRSGKKSSLFATFRNR